MKVNAIKSYQTSFGYNQNNSDNKNKGITNIIPTTIKPTAGLVSPNYPMPPLPNTIMNPPLAGLVSPRPLPKQPKPDEKSPAPMAGSIRMPIPTQTPGTILYPRPTAGIITPPTPQQLPPHLPEVTAGIIGHPDSEKNKKEIDKILKKM